MTVKNIKEEARKKLALNMHQAIVIYTVEFVIFVTLIALIVMSCVSLGVSTPAAIVMICYGALLCVVAVVASGMVNFALVDFYLATYRCKPYNIRRLGDTIARSNITKVLLISLKRTLLAFLLLLCLIVPGVIYLIRTSMANFLLISNPKMKASTALSASNKVMSGKTGAYFSLCMSLFGWYILGIVTLGLGFIFILPYTNLIKTVFYKRNLQGDKNVYNTVVQPVSVPYAVSTPGQPVPPVQYEPAAGQQTVAPQQQNPAAAQTAGPAPIDTLADEDLIDMKEAMRDFDSSAKRQTEIPEVPIAPVTSVKSVNAEPVQPIIDVAEPAVAVEPVAPINENVLSNNNEKQLQPEDDGDKVREIDGTNIVETERVLSTQEINLSAAARKRLFNSNDPPPPTQPTKNFMATGAKQSPNDFVTTEVNTEYSEPISAPISAETPPPVSAEPSSAQTSAGSAEEPVISDSEFEEFLRNFDGIPKPEAAFTPLKRSERANTIREERERRERPISTTRASESNLRQDQTDRAERIRREREERLNLNNKKQ